MRPSKNRPYLNNSCCPHIEAEVIQAKASMGVITAGPESRDWSTSRPNRGQLTADWLLEGRVAIGGSDARTDWGFCASLTSSSLPSVQKCTRTVNITYLTGGRRDSRHRWWLEADQSQPMVQSLIRKTEREGWMSSTGIFVERWGNRWFGGGEYFPAYQLRLIGVTTLVGLPPVLHECITLISLPLTVSHTDMTDLEWGESRLDGCHKGDGK